MQGSETMLRRVGAARCVDPASAVLEAESDAAIRCPVHGMTDCSPLLSGCSLVNELWSLRRVRQAAAASVRSG